MNSIWAPLVVVVFGYLMGVYFQGKQLDRMKLYFDAKFETIELRFKVIEARLDKIEERLTRIEDRLDKLEQQRLVAR